MFQKLKRESQNPQGWHIPPFRSLNDFIFNATWDKPNHNDENRLANRIINNLLYYQTNYFVLCIIVIFLIGFIFPYTFRLVLAIVIADLSACALLSLSKGFDANPFHYPSEEVKNWCLLIHVIAIIFLISKGLFVILTIVFIVILMIAVSITGVIIHATLRKRNLANKIVNNTDQVTLRATPVGRLLEYYHQHNNDQ